MKGKQQGGMKSHKKIDIHKNDSMNTKTYFKYDSDEDGGGDDDDIVEDKPKIYKKFQNKGFGKWYQEFKFVANSDESDRLPPGEIQNLKKQAGFVYNDAVIHNKSSKFLVSMSSNVTYKYGNVAINLLDLFIFRGTKKFGKLRLHMGKNCSIKGNKNR